MDFPDCESESSTTIPFINLTVLDDGQLRLSASRHAGVFAHPAHTLYEEIIESFRVSNYPLSKVPVRGSDIVYKIEAGAHQSAVVKTISDQINEDEAVKRQCLSFEVRDERSSASAKSYYSR